MQVAHRREPRCCRPSITRCANTSSTRVHTHVVEKDRRIGTLVFDHRVPWLGVAGFVPARAPLSTGMDAVVLSNGLLLGSHYQRMSKTLLSVSLSSDMRRPTTVRGSSVPALALEKIWHQEKHPDVGAVFLDEVRHEEPPGT